MSEIKLVFDEIKPKKKAPEHLADLTIVERREKAESLGLPAFRANQIATHYFCLLYTSPSPRDVEESRMPSSA